MNTENAITEEEHQRICDYLSQLKEYQAKTANLDLSSAKSIKEWENRARVMLDWLNDATRGEYEIVEKYREPAKEAPPEVMDAFFALQNATMDLAKNISLAADKLYKLTGIPREEQENLKGKKPTESADLTRFPNMTQYGLMDDKLSRSLESSDQIYLQEQDGQMCLAMCVNQAPKEEKKRVFTTIILTTADGTEIDTSQRIYAEDDAVAMTVANMIYTEKLNGNPGPYNFTPDQIWRAERGITDQSITPTAKQKEEVVRIIDKLRNTQMKINVRDELEAHYLKEDDHITVKKKDDHITEGYIEDIYMYCRKGHAKTEKGRVYDSYVFYDIPYLYTYNMSKGHIVLVDYRLLDTSDTTGNDSLTDVFKFYLLREIASMYQRKRDSKRILYDTLRKATGTPSPEERAKERPHNTDNALKTATKAQAKDDRDRVAAILTSWKRAKWINGYSDVKDGRALVGVDIVLNPKNYAAKAITKKDQVIKS